MAPNCCPAEYPGLEGDLSPGFAPSSGLPKVSLLEGLGCPGPPAPPTPPTPGAESPPLAAVPYESVVVTGAPGPAVVLVMPAALVLPSVLVAAADASVPAPVVLACACACAAALGPPP